MNWAKAARPTRAALSLDWYTTYGTVTFCIHVPQLEMSAPVQNRAKFGYLSAVTAFRSPRVGSGSTSALGNMARKRVAVLISGRGSNMAALVEAAKGPGFPAEIALVLSNRPDAGGLSFARDHSIATAVVDHTAFGKDREKFEHAMQAALDEHRIEFVCLAGFMRLLTPAFVARWHGRMLNIHPSLLPKYKGLHTHACALEAGDAAHGASVHFVIPELDAGSVVAQAAVPVLPGDSPETLAARVLQVEHPLLVAVLQMAAAGRIAEYDGQATLDGQPLFTPLRLEFPTA